MTTQTQNIATVVLNFLSDAKVPVSVGDVVKGASVKKAEASAALDLLIKEGSAVKANRKYVVAPIETPEITDDDTSADAPLAAILAAEGMTLVEVDGEDIAKKAAGWRPMALADQQAGAAPSRQQHHARVADRQVERELARQAARSAAPAEGDEEQPSEKAVRRTAPSHFVVKAAFDLATDVSKEDGLDLPKTLDMQRDFVERALKALDPTDARKVIKKALTKLVGYSGTLTAMLKEIEPTYAGAAGKGERSSRHGLSKEARGKVTQSVAMTYDKNGGSHIRFFVRNDLAVKGVAWNVEEQDDGEGGIRLVLTKATAPTK